MTALFMGVDVGTTRTKAVVYEPTGRVIAQAEAPTPWRRDTRGAELDAEVLASAVRDVTARAAKASAAGDHNSVLAGIGITGMGESGVLTDAGGRVLAPVRAWYDSRADVEQVRRTVGEADFHRAVGMPLDAQPSLTKILALRQEFPAAGTARRFWSVPEWAVRALGGDPGSELSLASRTGLLDVVTGLPWAGAHELLGGDLLGPLQPAGSDCGRAGGERVAAELGGAVLTVAGHDHQTAAFAAGAVRDGVLFDSMGTAEALLRFTAGPVDRDLVARLAAQRVTVGLTVVPGHYCVLTGLLTGLGLERVSALLDASDPTRRAALGQAALSIEPPSQVSVAMSGDQLRITVDGEVSPAQLWARAVHDLLGASAESLRCLQSELGPPSEVVATGGWLANPAVLQAKKRQFPHLIRFGQTEAGAAGAARLAAMATGIPVTFSSSWAQRPTIQTADERQFS